MERIILKECPKHHLTDFVWQKSSQRYKCKKCICDYVQRKRYRMKEKAVDYKGGKCQICGYDKCIEALEFHHLDPTQKDFSFSSKGYCHSWDKNKKELDKCICVCANCHREIHSRENKFRKDELSHYIKRYEDKYDSCIQDILKLRNEGLSYLKIAQKLHMGKNTVMKYYKRYCINNDI